MGGYYRFYNRGEFARVVSVNKPSAYIFSFMGMVDLLSILPSYTRYLLPVRAMQLLCVCCTAKTVLGQAIASVVMILGYTIIAVPTGDRDS